MDPEIVFIHGEGHFTIPCLLQSHLGLTGWAAYCSVTLSPATRVGMPGGPQPGVLGKSCPSGACFPWVPLEVLGAC